VSTDKRLRRQLADFLDWKSAHVGFDDVVKGIPVKARGVVPKGFAHSIWQVVEHIRIAQHDILDFSRNPKYREMKWPDDYWPTSPVPKSPAAWTRALAEYRADRRAMQRLAVNPRTDLLGKIPHGSGQTVLREVLLVADHTAYHVAQILDLRRALGIWE
jgi:DinB family protein